MEESISGFKQRGGWVTIVEHGERITSALEDAGVSGEAFEKWDEWRPKAGERYRTDIKDKTAKQASVGESEGEKAGIEPDEDLDSARDEFIDALEELRELDLDDAAEESEESAEYAMRAADSVGRKALRAIEGTVYRRIMTQVSPAYFDNELVSANIQRTRDPDQRYVFEVKINDDELKERVSERLDEYEEEGDRWRIETEPNTENLEAAEGADSSE